MKKIEYTRKEISELKELKKSMVNAFSKSMGVPKEYIEPYYNPARKVLNNLNNRLMRGVNEY